MYKQAIENLTSKEINFEAICIEIAKSNPSIFNRAFDSVKHGGHLNNYSHMALAPYDPIPDENEILRYAYKGLDLNFDTFVDMYNKWGDEAWFKETMEFLFRKGLERPEKIKAIKAHRSVTNYGLRESKEFIEELLEMAGRMFVQNPGGSW